MQCCFYVTKQIQVPEPKQRGHLTESPVAFQQMHMPIGDVKKTERKGQIGSKFRGRGRSEVHEYRKG
jgi:hypothetical protein